ncbi:MAG: hypothetical protein ABEJ36_03765 [Candidatus Nanosalina sp.]
MVQWKGEIDEKAGEKAQLLDELEDFNVPNFFVITPEEVRRLFGGKEGEEEILNSSLNRSIKREIKDAYDEVGMSSEVREASGRAKSLVGGQRNSQFVSIRVSGSEKEKYSYKLNVGSSSLFESLREVVSSYCAEESGHPAVLVQKMVEPDYTGALERKGRETIVEAVNGLGISLEEGLTKPHTYQLRNSNVQKVLVAEEQLEISRNPVRGENQRQKVRDDDRPFEREEIEDFVEKASVKDLDLKFVYKRGGFHVVDAYRSSRDEEGFIVSEKGMRAARGEISGRLGQEVAFSSQTMPPEEYPEALIAEKGGYTSRDGFRARQSGKPAVFRFSGQLSDSQRVELGPTEVEIEASGEGERSEFGRQKGSDPSNPFSEPNESTEAEADVGVVASEVLPIDPRSGKGVCLNRTSDQGYDVSERSTEAERIPESGYLSSYEDIFAFDGEKAVLDARRMSNRGREEAVRYLEADLKILLLQEPDRDAISAAVESGFDAYASPQDALEGLERVVAREEKRFIMKRLRDI